VADRQRTETLRIDLAQAARLEARRHQREVAAGENPARLAVIEADRDPERIGPPAMRVEQCLLEDVLASAGNDDLPAAINDLVGDGQHEVDALLMHEARDQCEHRAAGDRKSELRAKIVGVGALAVPVARTKGWASCAQKRGSQLSSMPFEDARELRCLRAPAQPALQPAAEIISFVVISRAQVALTVVRCVAKMRPPLRKDSLF
jgi:hypothetical protein